MKNFRKVLAMILVVATLFSFASVASAAKRETLNLDYADQETITAGYEAAVDVLTSIGILNGYQNGEEFYFKPAAEIDRDEVAKMVAVLANKGDDIQDYYAEACTFADVKSTWAASYVAYCYHAGYVDGRNATTFDPDASVTGIEVAKMMLCVMGFDADLQGYVGKDWKVNVLRDAKKVNLFANMEADFNPAANAKREEVAQMMFNMLGADIIIGYVSENVVKVTNAYYSEKFGFQIGGKDYEVSLKDADGKFTLYGQAVAANGHTVGEMYGFECDIVLDCQGRPYYRWRYIPMDANTQWAKVYAIPYTSRSVNGIKDVDTTWLFIDGQKQANAADAKWGTTTTAGELYNQKGLVVETYKIWNEYKDAYYTITVALHTEVGFVSWTGRYQGTPTYKVTDAKGVESKALKNTEGFEVGDVVLTHFCNADADYCGKYVLLNETYTKGYTRDAHDYYLAEEAIVTVTDASYTKNQNSSKWNRENSYFKASGEKYEYHYNAMGEMYENANGKVAFEDTYMKAEDRNVEYALYLDEAGYVALWTENIPEVDVEVGYFVENSWSIQLGDTVHPNWDKDGNYFVDDNNAYFCDVVNMDGTITEDVQIDAASYQLVKKAWAEDKVGYLAKYSVEEGVAHIEKVADNSASKKIVVGVGDVDPANGVSATTNTEILVRTWNPATKEYTYVAYQGYKELAKDYPGVIEGYNGEPATIQYFVNKNNVNRAEYIFIDAAAASATDKFFLLRWEETRTSVQTGAGIEYFEVFSAIIDGEMAQVLIDSDNIEDMAGTPSVPVANLPTKVAKGLYDSEMVYLGISVDGLPLYQTVSQVKPVEADLADWVEMNGDQLYYTKKSNGVVENFPLADEAVVWIITRAYDDTTGDYTKVSVKGYTEDDEFNAEIVADYGYDEYKVWVEENEDGLVTEAFVCRDVTYPIDEEDPEGLFAPKA